MISQQDATIGSDSFENRDRDLRRGDAVNINDMEEKAQAFDEDLERTNILRDEESSLIPLDEIEKILSYKSHRSQNRRSEAEIVILKKQEIQVELIERKTERQKSYRTEVLSSEGENKVSKSTLARAEDYKA